MPEPIRESMSGRDKPLPSLRRHLLTWFVGGAVVMVFAYTQLLEYYRDLGIDLRTQSILEQIALEYTADRTKGIPTERNLKAYFELADIPQVVRDEFSVRHLSHGEVQRFLNLDLEGSDERLRKEYEVATGDLCGVETCELLFFYPYRMPDGNWLYLLHGIVGSAEDYEELQTTGVVANAIGALFAALLVLISFLLVRNIDQPLRLLERWSGEQGAERADEAIPDLRYSEFDTLAKRLQSAFQQMREGVQREKLFLRHASHELRTPIAILASNVELMDRLTNRPDRSAAEQAAFQRQYRALEDVQLLIETLLWVNRQSEQAPQHKPVNLQGELEAIVSNYRYLLEGKAVTLVSTGDQSVVTAPVAAVRIVLSNLVRNAFQHTLEGEVTIELAACQVTITNAGAASHTANAEQPDGFGLGLDLVDLLCQRFAWSCDSSDLAGGRRTVVRFQTR